jgi:hypothetical protein
VAGGGSSCRRAGAGGGREVGQKRGGVKASDSPPHLGWRRRTEAYPLRRADRGGGTGKLGRERAGKVKQRWPT